MILHIRNMKSERCIIMVSHLLDKLNLSHEKVELGEVEVIGNPSKEKLLQLNNVLKSIGLELMNSEKELLLKRIKKVIKEYIFLPDDLPKENFTEYISNKLNIEYINISTIFSNQQGITIERYIIEKKIERAKEMLVYSTQSLSDIAFKLHYSSVAHLSNQFKRITGLTPTQYRQLKNKSMNVVKKSIVMNDN